MINHNKTCNKCQGTEATINKYKMKKLNVVFLALLFILSGCLKTYNDTYTVVNDTNKQVKINGFAVEASKGGFLYNETINIAPNSKFTILKGLGENSQPRGIFQVNGIDSVIIIFANTLNPQAKYFSSRIEQILAGI